MRLRILCALLAVSPRLARAQGRPPEVTGDAPPAGQVMEGPPAESPNASAMPPAAPPPVPTQVPTPSEPKPPAPRPRPRPRPASNLPIHWYEAASRVGAVATVGGTIVGTFVDKRQCLLHFAKDHPGTFSILIPRESFGRFPPKPDQYYAGKQLLVTGTVHYRDGRPVIVAKERGQIWIVGEALRR